MNKIIIKIISAQHNILTPASFTRWRYHCIYRLNMLVVGFWLNMAPTSLDGATSTIHSFGQAVWIWTQFCPKCGYDPVSLAIYSEIFNTTAVSVYNRIFLEHRVINKQTITQVKSSSSLVIAET